MSYLKRTADGRVIMPTFPQLKEQFNSVQAEIDFLNKEVIPALKKQNFPKSLGLYTKLIIAATMNNDFLPDVPKRELKYAKYFGYNGTVCFFRREEFMFDYDLTAEGKERLATIEEFESLPDAIRDNCVIER